MVFGNIRIAYLPVLRSLKRTFKNDPAAERQIVAAIRTSIAELLNNQVPEKDIIQELHMTQKMLTKNVAQVAYNEKIDSYSVQLTEEMIPTDGAVVDIKTPGDLLEEQNKGLDDVVGKHCAVSNSH